MKSNILAFAAVAVAVAAAPATLENIDLESISALNAHEIDVIESEVLAARAVAELDMREEF